MSPKQEAVFAVLSEWFEVPSDWFLKMWPDLEVAFNESE